MFEFPEAQDIPFLETDTVTPVATLASPPGAASAWPDPELFHPPSPAYGHQISWGTVGASLADKHGWSYQENEQNICCINGIQAASLASQTACSTPVIIRSEPCSLIATSLCLEAVR